MNSGDWIENLTALEFNGGQWKMHRYDANDYIVVNKRLKVPVKEPFKNHADHHVYV